MNLVSKVTSDDEFKFRFQIQVHLTADANVPDHCTAYALSDPKEKFLSIECQHDHESTCPQCEELKSALKEVEAALSKSSTIAEDVRDDLLYTYQNAVQAIQAWKAHQLRSLQQDKVRITVLGQLDSTINNFVYTDKNQVTVWKAFDTGPGKSVRWSGLQG